MEIIDLELLVFTLFILLIFIYLIIFIYIMNEYNRCVVFRLGHAEARGPGRILVFWPVDRMMRIDRRTITKVIEPQDVITRDNVSVRVEEFHHRLPVAPQTVAAVLGKQPR